MRDPSVDERTKIIVEVKESSRYTRTGEKFAKTGILSFTEKEQETKRADRGAKENSPKNLLKHVVYC